jgi:hypothetical protein
VQKILRLTALDTTLGNYPAVDNAISPGECPTS